VLIRIPGMSIDRSQACHMGKGIRATASDACAVSESSEQGDKQAAAGQCGTFHGPAWKAGVDPLLIFALPESRRSTPDIRGAGTMPAKHNYADRHRLDAAVSSLLAHRLRSRFQLFLQLVKKSPIGALGDERLRGGLDHPYFMEAQTMKAQTVLGVVASPCVVRHLLQGF
jgi:hypothetical protein